MEAIALAAHVDEIAMVHEAIEERSDRRGISEELWPVIQRAVGCHDGRCALIATHDNLEQVLGGARRELAHAEVVNDTALSRKAQPQAR